MAFECKKKCKTCPDQNNCKLTYYEKYHFEPLNHKNLEKLDLNKFVIIPFPNEILMEDEKIRKEGMIYLKVFLAMDHLLKKRIPITTHSLVQYLNIDIKQLRTLMNLIHKKGYLYWKTLTSRSKYVCFTDKGNRPDYTLVVNHWFEKFTEKFGGKPGFKAEEGKVIKDLLRQFPPEILCKLMDAYLVMNDEFVRKTGFSLKFLPDKINILQIQYFKKFKSVIEEAADWQIFEFMKKKSDGHLEGFSRDLIALYEKEVKRRNLTEEDLKKYLESEKT